MANATPPANSAVGLPGRRRLIATIAAIAAVVVLLVVAVTAQGYQSQEIPRLESSVWVLRDSGQYARVNTDLAEIDTVRSVDEPEAVWQQGSDAVLYAQGFRQRWDLDSANPQDLASEDVDGSAELASNPTPSGTREVVSAGRYVAYRADTGQISVSTLAAGSATALADPFASVEAKDGGEDRPTYTADAVGVSPDGLLAIYSVEEGAVRLFDAKEHRFLGDPQPLASPPKSGAALELTVIGDRWALLDKDNTLLWVEGGRDPLTLDLSDDPILQRGAADGEAVLIADDDGLVSVPLTRGAQKRLVDAKGVPAAPVVVGKQVYAAWVDVDSGTLWADGKEVSLSVPDEVLDSGPIRPVFRDNGDRAVLTEVRTGLIWTAPAGELIPLEQWAVDEPTQQEAGTVVVEDVAEQMPPVAVADAFGVRAGQQVILPVLYNDHDPNKKDVLTIDPDSVSAGLSDPAFGELSLVGNGQSLVVTVKASAGRTSFTYAATDGVSISQPVTVTLNVVDKSSNSEPVWCGVDACQQEWPRPQMLPGGSVIVSALSGWVDPEGDPFVLKDAYETDSSSPVMVVPMSDGRVAIRHTDPNAPDASISVTVVVEDSRGARAEKALDVRVTATPTLTAMPVALTARVGEPQSVRVTEHLSGGSGSYRLLDAAQTSASADGLEISSNPASGTVDLTAKEPGQYFVTYTAQDVETKTERSAVVRVTAVDGVAPLTIAPLTAFVRPGEDTTVDVLQAVQNTSGRVLILAGAESSSPRLNVGIVGNESIRVSANSEDEEPGAIGTATVSVADGAGAAVRGSVTVFLTPPSTATRPIVFADAVTVRAGALTRIDVTANDVAPRGEPLVVLPEVVGSKQRGELVFADSNSLRYLAPKKPGTYRLTYSVALERNPTLFDNGAVTVTVVPDGTNRAPTPATLEGRVRSGQSVSLEVPSNGMDADGDATVIADVEQPGKGKGTATVSAEGDAIVYRAPAGGVEGGQVTFAYTVRDTNGATGSGVVRIGVLAERVNDAAPVTFSDYARVGVGSATPVVLDPLANDQDPSQGTLELVELVPNAPSVPGNPLYERLSGLISSRTSLEDGRVVLRAGDVAGTNSFLYTVRSVRTGSTAQGLIVVSVADDDVLDHPVVSDTVLTARNRAQLADGGIDVVTDHVRWSSGDVDSLTLRLWGKQRGFSVKGNRIVGEAPADGALVPFQLAGSSGGRDVVAYGFLRIPAFDDLRVQSRATASPVRVDEGASKSFDIKDYVDLPGSDSIDVGSEFTVQRATATCKPKGSSAATYAAGSSAPWSDTCLVPVRLAGQKRWSHVEVPIIIRPGKPQLNLASISQTITPGTSEKIDLYSGMSSWEGGREGSVESLSYEVSYSGTAFTITQSGRTLTVEAHADARSGTNESATVTVSGYGSPTAVIRLVVGVAPPDAPRGATLTRQCAATASGCSIDVVGVSGEYDPFAGKPGAGLKLVSLADGARCDVAAVSVSGSRSVSVTWPEGGRAPGGQCQVSFVVQDAQGRTGTGTLILDLQGFPPAPASVTTVGYSATTVVLEVLLGQASSAHPAVSSVVITRDGRPDAASCASAGSGVFRCTVDGLVSGEPHVFTAAAVNSVGRSAPTSPHTTWAYDSPAISNVTATPVYRAGVTDTSTGVAELSIASSADASSFRIQETGEVVSRTGAVTSADVLLPPGPQSITVVPISEFSPPTGNADNEGGAVQVTVAVAGAPYFDPASTQAVAASNTSITVSGISVQANGSGRSVEVVYLAWRSGSPRCTVNSEGELLVQGAEAQSSSPTIGGLSEYQVYNVKACASNGFGVAESSATSVFTFTSVNNPTGDTSYRVATNPARNGDRYSYGLASAPSINAERGFAPQYFMYGAWRDDFRLTADSSPGQVKTRVCHSTQTDSCSGEVNVTATTAPTIVDVQFESCLPAQQQDVVTVSAAARGAYDFAAVPVAGTPGDFDVTITWRGAFAALSPITQRVTACP